MTKDLRLTLALALTAVFSAACRTAAPFDSPQRVALAQKIISGWAEPSRRMAAKAIERYGPPDAIAQGAVGWKRKGVWKRIVVWNAPKGGTRENVEETVAYRVPEGRREAIALFNSGVRVSEDGAEMSARSNDEALNYLALNLADEVARGARGWVEARGFYEKTAALAAAGKSSPYMRGILFSVSNQLPAN